MRTLICIDGPSGSGKSTLASGLSARVGWPVIEIGPLFRLTAHLIAVRRGKTPTIGASEVLRMTMRGEIAVASSEGAQFAASSLWVNERRLDEDLWDPILADLTRTVSTDYLAAALIRLATLSLICRTANAIVVGREAESLHPAGHVISLRLTAQEEIRRERKARQLRTARADHVLRCDGAGPTATRRPVVSRSVAIDTTDSSVRSLQELVLPEPGHLQSLSTASMVPAGT